MECSQNSSSKKLWDVGAREIITVGNVNIQRIKKRDKKWAKEKNDKKWAKNGQEKMTKMLLLLV
jgi:hypothetical protein